MNSTSKGKQNHELIKNIKNNNLLIVCKKINESLEKNEEVDENIINMLFINLLEENMMNEIIIIYNNIKKSNFIFNDKLKTILIRIYSDINIEKSIEILKNVKTIKRRMLIPILNSYSKKNDINIIKFYNDNLYNKFIMKSDDFKAIIKVMLHTKNYDNFEMILNNMSDNKCKIDNEILDMLKLFFIKYNFKIIKYEEKCCNCNNILRLIDINDNERNKLISNLFENYIKKKNKKKLNNFRTYLSKNKKVDIFLDAGNILYFADRKINYNSYKRLNSIVNKLLLENKNILIVIHERHINYLDKNDIMSNNEKNLVKKYYEEWKKKKIIYFTPNKMNDDWFFLYGGFLVNKSKIVTNDKLKDHIFNISEKTLIENTLSKWMEISIITYEFKSNSFSLESLKLNYPKNYSERIQKVNNVWHLPLDDNKWFCQGNIKIKS
jgi:hypothetical protein